MFTFKLQVFSDFFKKLEATELEETKPVNKEKLKTSKIVDISSSESEEEDEAEEDKTTVKGKANGDEAEVGYLLEDKKINDFLKEERKKANKTDIVIESKVFINSKLLRRN